MFWHPNLGCSITRRKLHAARSGRFVHGHRIRSPMGGRSLPADALGIPGQFSSGPSYSEQGPGTVRGSRDYVSMAAKTYHQRVSDAFADKTDERLVEFGDRYLDHILDASKALAESLRRTVIAIATLVTVFFLLAGAKSAQFTLGPLKLTNVSSVLTLIPALVAFLSYEFCAVLTAGFRFEALKTALIRKLHPQLFADDLHHMLGPISLQAWGTPQWRLLRATEPNWATKVLRPLDVTVVFSIFGATLGFIVYSFWYLFHDPHVSIIAVVASAVFSVLSLARATALLYDETDASD
jgi:hypothetical protein